jgi:hypothetical protein
LLRQRIDPHCYEGLMEGHQMTNVVPGFPETIDIAKAQAKRLVKALEPHCNLTHSQALEVVAKTHGERAWGAMSSRFQDHAASPPAYDLGLPHHPTGKRPPERAVRGWKPEELESLVSLLRTHPKVTTTAKYRSMLDRIVAEGCVVVGSVDGLLDAVSKDLGDFAFGMHGERMVELFDINAESYLYRPGANDESTTGFKGISVAGAAALMIKLERLGLDTHPEHLVSVVNKAAAGRGMLTKHELECLWYRSEKEGSGPQRLTVAPFNGYDDEPHDVFTTATGHTCSVYRGKAGSIEMVLVAPPKAG